MRNLFIKCPKRMFYEEMRMKKDLSCLSFCSLRFLHNNTFTLMATSFGTNAIVVTRITSHPLEVYGLLMVHRFFHHLGSVMRKGAFEHALNVRVHIILCMRNESSRPLHFIEVSNGSDSGQRRLRLRACCPRMP